MSPIKPTGDFDLFMLNALTSGPASRIVRARIGGALWRSFEQYGANGMPVDTVAVGVPANALPATPSGLRFGPAAGSKQRAFPEVSTNPGSPADELDDGLDEKGFDVTITMAKAVGTYQVLKDWCVALGGTFEELPTRS